MDYGGRALGRLIAGTRRQRGMTQEGLFGLAGTARTNLAGIEKGRKGHRDANLLTDCGGVNLRPGELMRMAEEAMGKDANWPEAEKRN